MTQNELEEVAEIINKVIDNTPHLKGEINVNWRDFSLANGTGKLIFWAEKNDRQGDTTTVKINAKDKFKKLFEEQAQTRKHDHGQFYHMLKYDYALSTIENKEIQLSALSYLWDNDPAEQTEFYRRHGFLKDIVDDKIEDNKNKIFIFCFADSHRDERAWKLYGQDETGIALGFRFKAFSSEEHHKDLFQLKDIKYDKGYDFDFINEIQFRLKKRFNKRLVFGGISTLSKFYKRDKYSWEREARLCFDYKANDDYKELYQKMGLTMPDEINLEKYFQLEHDTTIDRHFIKVKFQNPLFELEVAEIICGKNVTDIQIDTLKQNTDPTTRIWRRK